MNPLVVTMASVLIIWDHRNIHFLQLTHTQLVTTHKGFHLGLVCLEELPIWVCTTDQNNLIIVIAFAGYAWLFQRLLPLY